MLFGEHILLERKKLKLTVEQLSRKCSISRSYLTLIENNKRLPSKKVIPQIAHGLSVKTNIIINWYLEDIRDKLEKV